MTWTLLIGAAILVGLVLLDRLGSDKAQPSDEQRAEYWYREIKRINDQRE